MNSTKEKKCRTQVIISVLVLTMVLLAEMYLMINFNQGCIAILSLAVVALVAVYIMVDSIMNMIAEREIKREEHFENLYRSEKASYIILKKSFDEIEEKLYELQESAKVPTEEIINAQKGIAKVIINRNKENADAIINSNDQVLERLEEVEETHNTKLSSLSMEQGSIIHDFGNQTDMKLQDLLVQLKDTEIRLNQAIMNGTKVVMPAVQPYEAPASESIQVETFVQAETIEEVPVEEEILEIEEETQEEVVIPETIEEISVEEVILEPVLEEKTTMPDMSDPNKMMSPDDIAALLANMSPAEETAPEPVVEEKPAMPDLSDPNKPMSQDEIAALLASL